MKLKLPRRRWLVLAGCLAVIGCGLVLMHVEEAHRRYQRMLASYERVRMGMTPSEVRAAVAQPLADIEVWHERTTRGEDWQPLAADVDPNAPPHCSLDERTTWDGWIDHDLLMAVDYQDGKKACSKTLIKTTLDWRARAN